MKKASLSILLLALSLCLTYFTSASTPPIPRDPGHASHLDRVSTQVLEATADGSETDFLVILSEQVDLSVAQTLPSTHTRRRDVYDALRETAQREQAPLWDWLDARGVPYRPFYIVNMIHVLVGDRALIETLVLRPEVDRIAANPRIQHALPQTSATSRLLAPQGIEWNITQVGAPDVWNLGYKGQGLVIGGQDTGYDWDHPALINQYRGWNGVSVNHNYNWHDAIHSGGGSCGADSLEPCDDHSHGTHTMGTAVGDDGGDNQIGMAPGASWIGCRNMNVGIGTPATYLECFEFFLAPYPPGGDPFVDGRPDLSPDITINSWDCPPSEGCAWDALQRAVQAQRAAGILTVVSAGNSGSSCSSVTNPPAIYDAAYTVGATNSSDSLATFSSRGPVIIDGSNRLKPDVTAPGVNVRSSVRGGGYQGSWDGTSMAVPHVAGAVALLWSAVPGLTNDIASTEAYLNDNAVHIPSTSCDSDGVPNNLYGWGRLDIYAAVQDALSDAGVLAGRVQSTLGTSITGAQIQASRSPTMTTFLTTGTNGRYRAHMISDTYAVTVTVDGYSSQTIPSVVVQAGLTTTVNITLTPLSFPVTGTITAAGSHLPLSATVSVTGSSFLSTVSDAATGVYTLSLPSGFYNLLVSAPGYISQSQRISVAGPIIQDFVLNPLPPIAAFSSNSPNLLHTATVFTNTTTGVGPISDTWLFGDGTPPTTYLTHPITLTHFYTQPGRYTIWLTATNATGSSALSDTIGISASWVVRAYFTDRQMVDALATWREPWEVHYDDGYLVLDVTAPEYEQLLDAGFRLEIDQERTVRLNQPRLRLPGQTTGIPGYPCYLTVEETFATAEAIAANYPRLATWTDIGNTWEKDDSGGAYGDDMMVLRLTNSSVPGPKPKLFIMTAVHAREYAPAELSTRFARYLVDNYDANPDVTWLLDYHEIHLLLQANPDGRKWAQQGYSWRKNTNNNYCPNTHWRGADLNRNFEFRWGCCGGSSSFECSEVYRGEDPASEPETQAIQNYVRAQFPDQRDGELSAAAPFTATGVFMDIHSYGELVLWPWGFTDVPTPNDTALRTLGQKFAFFNRYSPQQAHALYPTDGTSDDFAYGELGLAAFAFELGTDFFQDCDTFEDTILPDNLPALIYAAKVSRAPYLTPAGPDALDLVVTPELLIPGQAVELTATIDDTRYHPTEVEPTQVITAAEYYVDTPPWVTGTARIAYTMRAIDGAFDEKNEKVRATIDTRSLDPGRHTLFVRGKDAEGNWGAFSAAFFTVVTTPTVEFTSSSPAFVGKPVTFTNLTLGTPPIEFFWDFGDNRGTSRASDPTYTYRSSGTFTVTLVATNSLGSDSASHPIAVGPPQVYLPIITKFD